MTEAKGDFTMMFTPVPYTIGFTFAPGGWYDFRCADGSTLPYWLCRCGFARTAVTTCPLCGEGAPK